jgi:hypothetical protein
MENKISESVQRNLINSHLSILIKKMVFTRKRTIITMPEFYLQNGTKKTMTRFIIHNIVFLLWCKHK